MNERFSSKNRKVCYILASLFGVVYIIYCKVTFVELPHMTWFDQIPLADLYYSGKLQISDLFSRYGEHGMLANNLIYLVNVIFFHGTTLFDVYLNDFNVMVSGGLLIYSTIKTLEPRRSMIFWVMVESVFMFSFFQASSGAMETQVRLGLLFFLLAMLMVDQELGENECSKLHFAVTEILIVLSINVFGTLYSFAGVPCVWAIIIFLFFKNRKWGKRSIIIASTYLATIPIYLIEYGDFLRGESGIGASLLSVFLHPIELMKGVFAWYANGVLGWAFHESSIYRATFFLAVGAVVFILTLLSVILFFREQMYKKTWLPLMCIVYGIGVFTLVLLGRADGWEWFSNEWYTVHIKISIASTIWIFAYSSIDKKGMKIGAFSACIFLLAIGIVGNVYTIKRAPSVHNYYVEKQKYLYIDNEADMPVNEAGETPLLHSLNATMNSIDIMKKYNLSVYQYWDAFEACPTTRSTGIKYITGKYDDGWCEQEMRFSVHVDNITKLEVSLNYSPATDNYG